MSSSAVAPSEGVDPRFREVLAVARDLGLDFFAIKFEVVPLDVMTEIAAYGLPVRAQHWSYGKVYSRQRLHGRMGLSKIYEIVLNNDPSYAFLLDSNRAVENLLIVAHVAAHADFFKNNVLFAATNRQMISEAADHAVRVDGYRESYGIDTVERLMDIGFSLDRHIDWHRGVYRDPYPGRQVVTRIRQPEPYGELFPEREGYSVERQVIHEKFPPQPERDLLWFLANYAPLEDWERDILEIMREESYYFYPQFMTKIVNEGWATFWHAEVLGQYDSMSPQEMVDFATLHSAVVQPGGAFNVNPYYLGYRILVDVEKRWNHYYERGESEIDGREKLFQVRREEDDLSFLRNYLTQELVEELNLYTYGYACEHPFRGLKRCPKCGQVAIQSREVADVVEMLAEPRYNYGLPLVVVDEVVQGVLGLRQWDVEKGGLDRQYAEKTLEGIHQLWKGPVVVKTADGEGHPLEMRFDSSGFRVGPGDQVVEN